MKVTPIILGLLGVFAFKASALPTNATEDNNLAERGGCKYGIGEVFQTVNCNTLKGCHGWEGGCENCYCVDYSLCCFGVMYITRELHTPTGRKCIMACGAFGFVSYFISHFEGSFIVELLTCLDLIRVLFQRKQHRRLSFRALLEETFRWLKGGILAVVRP